MIKLSETRITLHFLERYVYRFDDNRLENILKRIARLKKPTNQQFNRIKKHSDRNKPNRILVDGDLVVICVENTLLTCWRLP